MRPTGVRNSGRALSQVDCHLLPARKIAPIPGAIGLTRTMLHRSAPLRRGCRAVRLPPHAHNEEMFGARRSCMVHGIRRLEIRDWRLVSIPQRGTINNENGTADFTDLNQRQSAQSASSAFYFQVMGLGDWRLGDWKVVRQEAQSLNLSISQSLLPYLLTTGRYSSCIGCCGASLSAGSTHALTRMQRALPMSGALPGAALNRTTPE